MSTFTSSLPDDLLESLAAKSKEMAIPKNKLIEKALRIYIDQLERAAYIQSYKRANNDSETMKIAEDGMADYLAQINLQDGIY